VPFSTIEWEKIPAAMKEGLDLRESRSVLGRPLWVPFRPRFLPPGFGTFIREKDLASAMRAGTMEEKPGSCPFSDPSGCLVYEERPIICRLFGTNLEVPFTCKRNLTHKNLLSINQIMEIMGLWALL
jgi:Fe-S-cluster containining protein